MNKDEKAAVIEEVTTQIKESEAIFAVDYRGMSVTQAAELRTQLSDAGTSLRVVKNRLTKIAVDQAGDVDSLKDYLEGPTAFAFVKGDAALAAKAISRFTKDFDILQFKGGFMGGEALTADQLRDIAKLPARDVLIGQFAGLVASPITGLVRGLGSMIGGLAVALGQIAEQGLVTGEAPAPEPAAEEAPAEEAEAAAEPEASTEPGEEAPAEEAPAAAEAPAEEDTSGEAEGSPEDTETDETKEDQ